MTTITMPTMATPTMEPESVESRWDKTIANALNEAFCYNAQVPMMKHYRPYFPCMPLPIDKPISECRDYEEYEWNKTLIRYDRAFGTQNYSLCYRLLDELSDIHHSLIQTITLDNQYIDRHMDAAHSIRDAIWHRQDNLDKVSPQPVPVKLAVNNQPIQWRAA